MDSSPADYLDRPSDPSSAYINGHYTNSMAAGPSRLVPSSDSIDLTGSDDEQGGGKARISHQARASMPSPHHQSGPSSSPIHATLMNSSPSTCDVEITGAKLATPSVMTPSDYDTPSFRQYPNSMNGSIPTVLNPSSSTYIFPNMAPGQGWASSIPSSGPIMAPHAIGSNGYGMIGNGGTNGISASSAIDLTNARLPSPPPISDKKPVCIGSLSSKAVMLYPSMAAVVGAMPQEGSRENYQTMIYRGAELLKVKLKVCQPSS